MTACLVLGLLATPSASSGATYSSSNPLARVAVASDTYSGAASDPSESAASRAQGLATRVIAPEQCPDARKAVRYYGRKLGEWRVKMGASGTTAASLRNRLGRASNGCPHVRRLAHTLQRKAHNARLAYLNWHYHEYRWDHWLPQLWVAIGECETGLNWHHNSGTYEGAFGFYKGSWDAYKPSGAPSAAYLASPRQQYQAALNIQARVGLNAWGCYSHGGYKYHMR